MRSIELNRAEGKTTALVLEMLKPGNEDMVFVAPTFAQAKQVGLKTALHLGEEDSPELRARFVRWGGGRGQFEGKRVRLVIDEANYVLESVFGAPVHMLAYTPEDE